jgi:4-amino-4-deoxy-L-arabinose transferase-like glycosyltransferase
MIALLNNWFSKLSLLGARTMDDKKSAESYSTASSIATDKLYAAATFLVLAAGVLFRIYPSAGFHGIGFDENLYRVYVDSLTKTGITGYPAIVDSYIEFQKTLPGSILPPMRFFYIFAAYLWKLSFGIGTLPALLQVACFFSILTLIVAFAFTLRIAGRATALGVLALMSCAPTQIHMSQHALVDGVFAFWALLAIWALWENLRSPNHTAWLSIYGFSLAVMVMTKENAAFVFVAVAGILACNQWLRFGSVTRRLLWVTCAASAAAVLLLVALAGGLESFFAAYILSVSKNFTLTYAIKTGDGPWYRYLVDLMLVNPVVLIAAIAEISQLRLHKKPQLYLALFLGFSYLVMCNLRYGMNLRYANMWDMPLCLLAVAQLTTLSRHFGRRQALVLALSLVGLCAYELHQYRVFFVDSRLYELVSEGLLRAVNILK